MKRKRWLRTWVCALVGSVLAVGCGEAGDGSVSEGEVGRSDLLESSSDFEGADDALHLGFEPLSVARGLELFTREKFRGNGRTCATCHAGISGTLNPEQIQRAFQQQPNGPIFRSIDSDDGVGSTFTRLLKDATVLVNIPLPPNVSIAGSSARQVVLARGIPSSMNTPALDPVLMLDGRQPNLPQQALSAVFAHAEPGRTPTPRELSDIATFERKALFNRPALARFAAGGPAPQLPPGRNDSERRGRFFMTDDAVTGFRCTHCHTGPMLNETSPGFQTITGVPAGSRFFNIAVSEFNRLGRPVLEYEFSNPGGSSVKIASSDPGRALITGNPADIGAFKILSVWGAKETAPYFHDNSAKTFEEMMEHYDQLGNLIGPAFDLSEQDKKDIIAYIKRL